MACKRPNTCEQKLTQATSALLVRRPSWWPVTNVFQAAPYNTFALRCVCGWRVCGSSPCCGSLAYTIFAAMHAGLLQACAGCWCACVCGVCCCPGVLLLLWVNYVDSLLHGGQGPFGPLIHSVFVAWGFDVAWGFQVSAWAIGEMGMGVMFEAAAGLDVVLQASTLGLTRYPSAAVLHECGAPACC